jgi:hypothetical protein
MTTRAKAARALIGVSGLAAVALIATPWWLLPVCEAHGLRLQTAAGGFVPMKCSWSANVLVALGVLALGLALVGLALRQRESLRVDAIALAAIYTLALLVPTKLIGVCMAPTHPCRAATLPAVLAEAAFGLACAVAAAALVSLAEKPEPSEVPTP